MSGGREAEKREIIKRAVRKIYEENFRHQDEYEAEEVLDAADYWRLREERDALHRACLEYVQAKSVFQQQAAARRIVGLLEEWGAVRRP